MVDVFDRHGVRFDPRLTGCSRFVRYSDYAALEAQLANVKERAKDAASMCEAGYPVSAFNLATSILSALEATPPTPREAVPHRWECEFPGGSFFVDTKAAADVHEAQGAKITPLYVSLEAPRPRRR